MILGLGLYQTKNIEFVVYDSILYVILLQLLQYISKEIYEEQKNKDNKKENNKKENNNQEYENIILASNENSDKINNNKTIIVEELF